MTALITSATGFLGQHLTRLLQRSGVDVVALTHDRDLAWQQWSGGTLHTARGDVRDLELMRRLISRFEVDTVYHLAAQTQIGIGFGDPLATLNVNVHGTVSVLEACRLEGVRRVVCASSDKCYGEGRDILETAPLNPQCPYGVSKAAADVIAQSYARNYGMSIAITRCGNIYGPGDTHWRRLIPHVCRQAVRGEPPIMRKDGQGVRDWIFVDDVAFAYYLLGNGNGVAKSIVGPVNLAGGEPTKAIDVAMRLLKQLAPELKPLFRPTPVPELMVQTLKCDWERLGWRPQVSLEEGLNRTATWYAGNCR